MKKTELTKGRLIAAAADVIRLLGWELATRRVITDNANVSHQTIYNHFKSVRDLKCAALQRLFTNGDYDSVGRALAAGAPENALAEIDRKKCLEEFAKGILGGAQCP